MITLDLKRTLIYSLIYSALLTSCGRQETTSSPASSMKTASLLEGSPGDIEIPSIDLKVATALNLGADNTINAGDIVQYFFTVTNTGNVSLSQIILRDELSGMIIGAISDRAQDGAAYLAPGGIETANGTYAITLTDIYAGSVPNTAHVSGQSPNGTVVWSYAGSLEVLPMPPPSGSFSGAVYLALIDNGVQESNERGISNVTVTLQKLVGTTWQKVSSTVTNSYGAYSFKNLPAATYRVIETQPYGYREGIDSLGTVNGILRGSHPAQNIFMINLKAGENAKGFKFSERPSKLLFM